MSHAISQELNESSTWTSLAGLFFALTGVLIATSVVNIGDSGIAFFYMVFPLAAFALLFPGGWAPWLRMNSDSFWLLILVVSVAILLLGTTVLQILVMRSTEPVSEVVHFVSRVAFLAYFVVAQRLIRGEVVNKTLIWLRRLLIIVCAYGVYQVPAKLLGLPLFLDWLRNNHSFLMYDYNDAGWINIARANSIYAEPSQATVPLVVLFILNVIVPAKKASKTFGWIVLVLFAVATFSRTAWVALAVAIVALLLSRSHFLRRALLQKRVAVVTIFMILLLLMPFWGVISMSDRDTDADLSEQERSAGIILGINSIRDAPILGHGWNSFKDVADRYADVPLMIDPEIEFTFIHNMVISYIEQAGLAGLLLAALPFVMLICWSTAPTWITFSTLAAFLFAAEFGGDIGYASLTWLWMALLVNMNCTEAQQVSAALNVLPPSYTAPVSALPPISS
jgi:O-antigen ligase